MARGWESKAVEQQQEEAVTRSANKARLTPQQLATAQRLQGLNLSRSRVLQQLENAKDPRHREMLEKALADLDAQLANLV